MTVKQLIKELSNVPGNTLVILSSDSEGNQYSEVNDLQINVLYDKEGGSVGLKSIEGLDKLGFTEDDLGTGEDCVVIYPK